MYIASKSGLQLLESFEGCILHPYQKAGDIPTIGIGTTFYPNGKMVTLNDPSITKEQAYEYAESAINKIVIPTIERVVKVPLSQNKVNALVSFTFNEGSGALAGSHLLQLINIQASCSEIAKEFGKWIYVDHKISQWQIFRRAEEAQVFCS